MLEVPTPAPRFGPPTRGVTAADVERAADSLLRLGHRPTIERIREQLGTGSPNTINPMLDAWWKRLSARLSSGPAALHRLPESVAHVAEALWMQALDEGRRRALLELKSTQRAATEQRQSLEVRSHVLTLREGELDARLRARETTIADLNLQLRELTLLLRKEQATRAGQAERIAALEGVLSARVKPPATPVRTKARPKPTTKKQRQPAQHQRPPATKARKKSKIEKRRR